MSLPQKHNFEMHICGFDFDVLNMEDDSFFLEDRFSTFDRDLKNKKNMVPMTPEGVHGQPLGLPDYIPQHLYGPSEATMQTASQSIQLFLHR